MLAPSARAPMPIRAFSGSGESLALLPWPHGSQGDAKHRPETRIVAKFTQATYTCLRDALLTMRVRDLILRSIAKRCVSKDEAIEVEIALVGKTRTACGWPPMRLLVVEDNAQLSQLL